MNYWNITAGDLESIMSRRPTGVPSFDGITANFPFEMPNQPPAQHDTRQGLPSLETDRSGAKGQGAGQQAQQQQQVNRTMASTPPVSVYQRQMQQQGIQRQEHQRMPTKDVKMEPIDRPQQSTAPDGHGAQVKQVEQMNNEMFLFPSAASAVNSAIGPSMTSVPGMLVTAIPVAVSMPGAVANMASASSLNQVKPKKKKQKKPAATSMAPSMVAQRPPAPRAQCLLCDRNYGNRRDLRRHVLAHHEGVRYMCRLCSKVMMSSKSVRAHLKSSAHRLMNDDEISLNIEKMTPTVGIDAFSALGASGSSGGSATNNAKKDT